VTGGTIRFQGGLGTDILTLASNSAADQVVFSTLAETGDLVTGFETGTDKIVLTGALRTTADRNGDGTLSGASRAQGAINMASDEVVRLTTAATTLTDTDFANVRTAIGSLTNSAAGASVVVLANNGTNTGAYLVTDTNGDNQVAATEIRLLGVFNNNSSLTFTDITLG
jgi:hypothetical protein